MKCLISSDKIAQKVKELGQNITEFYKNNPIVIVCVLKGSFVFVADLVRNISSPVQIEFIGVKSYSKNFSTGSVQITQDLTSPINDKDVLLVEDIVDTGTTYKFLLDLLAIHNPKSLRLCSLLYKPAQTKVNIDFLGFEIPDEFVVGYGLDYNQMYRNLPYIAVLVSP